jgi:peptidoglycan hydrolase-like protein with peptidoglycan-binding domain
VPWLRVEMHTIDLRNAQTAVVQGRHVDNLQGLLAGTRNTAWDPGPIDGVGGPRTRSAVLAFQSTNSLVPDAIVGPLTWGRLISFANAPVTALPPDNRPKTPTIDATGDFAGIGPQPSLAHLAARVIAEVERRHPDTGGDVPMTTEWAVNTGGATGTIFVRRDSFPDDSVAGVEYTVSAQQSGSQWAIASAKKSTICWRGVSGQLCT